MRKPKITLESIEGLYADFCQQQKNIKQTVLQPFGTIGKVGVKPTSDGELYND